MWATALASSDWRVRIYEYSAKNSVFMVKEVGLLPSRYPPQTIRIPYNLGFAS